MEGTITVFSTAAHLTATRDTEPIAAAFGVPEQDVFTRDWLEELVDDDRSDPDWQESASIAAVCIHPAMVLSHDNTQRSLRIVVFTAYHRLRLISVQSL